MCPKSRVWRHWYTSESSEFESAVSLSVTIKWTEKTINSSNKEYILELSLVFQQDTAYDITWRSQQDSQLRIIVLIWEYPYFGRQQVKTHRDNLKSGSNNF